MSNSTSVGETSSRKLPEGLVNELRRVVGPDRVHTDAQTLYSTSHDASPLSVKWKNMGHHPHQADIVVEAWEVPEIARILHIATQFGVSVTPHGLGSSVTGQSLPTRGGIRLDLSELNGETHINETDLTVTVPASARGSDVEAAVNDRGYTLGNSPQSLLRSSVGGWVSTLETGQFSSRYGGIENLVTRFDIVLADGQMVKLGASPRAAMGPDLRQLFIGSEGTLGIVTSVTMKIFPIAQHRRFAVMKFPTVDSGLAFMREQAAYGFRPLLLRLYDLEEARHVSGDRLYDSPMLYLGVEGMESVVEAEYNELLDLCHKHGGIEDDSVSVESWMNRRFDFSTVENLLAEPGGYAETIEVAHTWGHLLALYERLKRVLAGPDREILAHFSHVYTQGSSLYIIVLGRAASDEQAEQRLRDLWNKAMETCIEMGAELSHHHGGGLIRSPFAVRSLGASHRVLRELKDALDPSHILNPGKLGL